MIKRLLWAILRLLSARLCAWAFKAHQLALALERMALEHQNNLPEARTAEDLEAFMQQYRARPSHPDGPPDSWLQCAHSSVPPQHWVEHVRSRLAELRESQQAHLTQPASPGETSSAPSQAAQAGPALAGSGQARPSPPSTRRLTTPGASPRQDAPWGEALSPEARLLADSPAGTGESVRPDRDQRQLQWEEPPAYNQGGEKRANMGQPASQPRPRLTFRVNSVPPAPERATAQPQSAPPAGHRPEQSAASAASRSDEPSELETAPPSWVSQRLKTAPEPPTDWQSPGRYHSARPARATSPGRTSRLAQAEALPDSPPAEPPSLSARSGAGHSVLGEGAPDASGSRRFTRKIAPLAAAFPWRGGRRVSPGSPASPHPIEEDAACLPSEEISGPWPSLAEDMNSMEHLTAPALDDGWEAALHQWRRLRRLDREQQGWLWSESPF